SGFASGQIRSSTATADRGLGWIDDAGNSRVHVAPALYGDADLSGRVDLTDFTFLASNFNKQSGATWNSGDFNYDDKVDLTDFTLLASNFNQTLPADAGSANSFGNVLVREPSALAVLAAARVLLSWRQRRHVRA